MTRPPQGIARLAAWAGTPLRPPEPPAAASAHCELCPTSIGEEHRHLLQLDERRIVCVCATCWSLHSGDAEYRPAGLRTLWLEGFEMPDDLWGALSIPIGLAFLMRSSSTGGVAALYPGAVGATESQLDLSAWEELCALNPRLEDLEPDAEALLVNRLADPPQYAIVPIDRCYKLVGLIKSTWEGLSGGPSVKIAVASFFEDLRETALVR